MNKEQIKTLLARFYAGESTPEEERSLSDRLLDGNDDPGFEADRILFRAMKQLETEHVSAPEELSDKLSKTIDRMAAGERRTKRLRLWRYSAVSLLAAACIGVVAFVLFSRGESNLKPAGGDNVVALESQPTDMASNSGVQLADNSTPAVAEKSEVRKQPEKLSEKVVVSRSAHRGRQLSPERTAQILEKMGKVMDRVEQMHLAEAKMEEHNARMAEVVQKFAEKRAEVDRTIESVESTIIKEHN